MRGCTAERLQRLDSKKMLDAGFLFPLHEAYMSSADPGAKKLVNSLAIQCDYFGNISS